MSGLAIALPSHRKHGTKGVMASQARQSMRSVTTVDRFVPRDDAIPVMASQARQFMRLRTTAHHGVLGE